MYSHTEIGLWPHDAYPHTCSYFRKMKGAPPMPFGMHVVRTISEMRDWCRDNVPHGYIWSGGEFTSSFMINGKVATYPTEIGFARAEDLLAFKLRFGL